MLIGAMDNHGHQGSAVVDATLNLAKTAIRDSLTALWEDVRRNEHLLEGDVLVDSGTRLWRIGVLRGALAVLAFANDGGELLPCETARELDAWLCRKDIQIDLWGEAAVGNLVPWLVRFRRKNPTIAPDYAIAELAKEVMYSNQRRNAAPLPSPYYSFLAVARQRSNLPALDSGGDLDAEDFEGRSYTAELLLHLLVRTWLKDTCKALWPAFTRLGHSKLVHEASWQYCLLRVDAGVEETRHYPSTYQWADLKRDAIEGSGEERIPAGLTNCPWLLAMWWQVAPHRLTSDSCRAFVRGVAPAWGV